MKAQFYFTSSPTDADIIRNSYQLTEVYYNELAPADNSLKFSVPYNTALSNALKLHVNDDVKVVILGDDDAPLFSGYVRKRIGFSKIIRNDSISIECVSPSFLLNKKAESAIVLEDNTVHQIWRALCRAAGFSSFASGNPVITDRVPIFFLKVGDNYKEAITELLFEYGYTFDFDAYGAFKVCPLFDAVPDEPVELIDGDAGNLHTQVTQQFNERRYDGMSAQWKDCVSGSELLFQDLDEHVSGDPIFDGAWIASYQGSKEVIYISSISTDIESGGQQVTVSNKGDCAEIEFADVSNPRVTKIAITGTGYFSTSINTTNVTDGNNPVKHEIKYCFSESKIEDLAGKVRDYYKYSGITATFRSSEDMAIGSFATLNVEGMGEMTGRIIRKVTNLVGYPQYELESVTEYEPSSATTDRRNTRYNSSLDNAVIQQAQTLIHGVRTLASLDETGAYTNEVGNYDGTLYEWTGSAWSKCNTSGYLGAYSSGTPLAKEGNFFLATADFINPVLYAIEAGPGYVLGIGDYVLGVNGSFTRGYIYEFNGSQWEAVTDPNDYRYVVALADLYSAGLGAPPAVKSLIEDETDEAIAVQTPDLVREYTPKSYHAVDSLPDDAHEGDWCVWNGTGSRTVGDIYQYDGSSWVHRQPDDSRFSTLYMQSLDDVLGVAPNVDGRFSTVLAKALVAQRAVIDDLSTNSVFAQQLMAQQAAIDELNTKVIALSNGGLIKGNFNGTVNSSGQITNLGTRGFAITSNGESVFNNTNVRGSFKGSKVIIEELGTVTQQIISWPSATDVINWAAHRYPWSAYTYSTEEIWGHDSLLMWEESGTTHTYSGLIDVPGGNNPSRSVVVDESCGIRIHNGAELGGIFGNTGSTYTVYKTNLRVGYVRENAQLIEANDMPNFPIVNHDNAMWCERLTGVLRINTNRISIGCIEKTGLDGTIRGVRAVLAGAIGTDTNIMAPCIIVKNTGDFYFGYAYFGGTDYYIITNNGNKLEYKDIEGTTTLTAIYI